MNPFLALQFTPPDVSFALIAPELIICVVGVIVMLVDAFARPEQRWVTGSISLAGLLAGAAVGRSGSGYHGAVPVRPSMA